MTRLGVWAVGVVAVVVVLAACGSSTTTTSTKSGGSTSATTTPKSTYKVGLVTDIGGLNDHGFNHLAYEGLLTAEKQLGIQGRVLPSSSGADYLPNLTTLAQQGYNLVIPVGFLMAAATDSVAKQFPNVKFAMIDSDATAEKGDPKNIEGLLFKEQEAGYLAGYLAGLYAKAHGYKTISSVGGQKIPPVDHYIAGYQAGAKKADPGIQTLNGYSQDFVDQAKCKQIALNQIQQGSKVVFQVAGACGLGALSAAQQSGVQGIGVDADQSYLGSYILTSAEKKVDVAVVNAIKNAMAGKFAPGANVTNDIANGGIGYGKIGPAGLKFSSQIATIYTDIKSGKIANIPNTVP
ncbi:MAG TPA: BMP family ABC transporter substrate-binding protein [Solirubrobacteraceae bacterium]|jgi:basic membrane protein A|nr:BMP family ABC transporter substrate-binding protein [Solirubrobacteraceae bacterium]